MAKEQVKKFWKSKGFWINIGLIVGGLLTAFSEQAAVGTAITIPGVINLVIRVVTNSKLDWSI